MRFLRVILKMLFSLFYQLQILVSSQNPLSARILIRSPSKVLSIHLQNRIRWIPQIITKRNLNGFSMASSTQWHSSPNTNLVALSRSMNHLKSMDDALNQRSTRHWVASGPNQLHVFKNSAIQSTSQTRFQHILCATTFAVSSRISAHIAHDLCTLEREHKFHRA